MIIKQSPEDFFVEEIPNGEPGKEWNDSGAFAVFKLTKTNLNTEQTIEIISKRFHIPSNTIKYSGTKDKHAHTIQYISIPNHHGINQIRLDEDNLKLEHVGYNDEPLSLGTLKGNRFIITVRELTHDELNTIKHKHTSKKYENKDEQVKIDSKQITLMPNYFDEQRFSSNNYNIGLSILKKDYKSAVNYMCKSSNIYSDTITIYLAAHPNDYVGALQHIPKKTLLMFIHAVQSFIFNEALSKLLIENALKKGIKFYLVPYSIGRFVFYENYSDYKNITESLELVGFDTHNVHHEIKHLMTELGLTQRDFIVRAIPELSVDGTTRDCFVNMNNLEIEIMDNRVILEF